MFQIAVIALLLPGLLFLIGIVLLLIVKQRDVGKARRDRTCDQCGCTLAATPGGTCPKCGSAIAGSQAD